MRLPNVRPSYSHVNQLTYRRSGGVFVPAGVSQASVAANASTTLGLLPLLPPSCAAALQTFVCALAFRPCDALGQPLPICAEVCTSARGNCTSTLADARIANCATATDQSGELYFEDGTTVSVRTNIDDRGLSARKRELLFT